MNVAWSRSKAMVEKHYKVSVNRSSLLVLIHARLNDVLCVNYANHAALTAKTKTNFQPNFSGAAHYNQLKAHLTHLKTLLIIFKVEKCIVMAQQ